MYQVSSIDLNGNDSKIVVKPKGPANRNRLNDELREKRSKMEANI